METPKKLEKEIQMIINCNLRFYLYVCQHEQDLGYE